jgi:hypothetical protein
MKFFNTTGPCNPDDHYMLPPAERLVGAQLHRYVRDKLYWVLHAPRQVGKTTFLHSWMRELNAAGEVAACYVSIEQCQGIKDPAVAIPGIAEAIRDWAPLCGLPVLKKSKANWTNVLKSTMAGLAEAVAPKPLVVFLDEVDVMEEDVMVSSLRQLRNGFAGRGPGVFPVSIALVGMKDLRDYIEKAKDGISVNPGSPFNVKAASIRLGNFTQNDLARLFAQRTEETGQRISPEALAYAWEQSQGQPWIVNNLFMRATLRILDENDFSTVELHHVQAARAQMVEARETHLDALAYRLENPEVRKIIEMMLVGDTDMNIGRGRGLDLCVDLGLVVNDSEGLRIANPIYREVLGRELSHSAQTAMPPASTFRWQKPDGALDLDLLLSEFQKFWRSNSELWEAKSDYTEVFPHLLLMAFLQRLLNGGGHINREFALGRGRLDLHIEYKGDEFLLELKLLREHDSPSELLEESLEQIKKYRDGLGPSVAAYLLLFDRRSAGKKAPWDERVYWRVEADGVTIVGL